MHTFNSLRVRPMSIIKITPEDRLHKHSEKKNVRSGSFPSVANDMPWLLEHRHSRSKHPNFFDLKHPHK